MKLRIKKLHPDAVIPSYAKPGDAGLDLTAISEKVERVWGDEAIITYGTGLAFEIPPGHVGLIFPRSSICKTDLRLMNSVGVLDSGYRGEVTFKFAVNMEKRLYPGWKYKPGDRIGQMIVVPYPVVEFEEVAELSNTERGDGGYGSSGK